MLNVHEAVLEVQRLLRVSGDGTGIFVWPDGSITTTPPSQTNEPEQLHPDVPDPLAKFIAGRTTIPDQEIEDRIHTGMASDERRRPVESENMARRD